MMPAKTRSILKILGHIWGGDREGYVFMPWIDGDSAGPESRRQTYHEGRAFHWPRERDAISAHIAEHSDDDLYFTPALFSAKRRIEQNIAPERCLWADLDPVDPESVGQYRPTIAWETSPGRYQAVWLMDTPMAGASQPSRENHRLTLALGADPSGWDSTQLLRVPGLVNHKYPGGAPGRLLWSAGPRYTWADFDDLPEVQSASGSDLGLADEDLINSIDLHDVWGRVRLVVSSRCRELYHARAVAGDRSEALWEMERELADAGCSVVEIIALVRATVWNKYSGRNDELKRLQIEASKAISMIGDKGDSAAQSTTKPGRNWLRDIATTPMPRPDWLVDGIWTTGACGFIAGPPKSYKSWVALDLAVSVSTGRPFLGVYRVKKPGPVLYLQEEDSLRLVWDRLGNIVEQRAPESFWHGQVHISPESPQIGTEGVSDRVVDWEGPTSPVPEIDLQVQSGFIASDPAWQAWLEESVATENYALIVIDTLSTTAGEVDTDKSIDLMTKILRPLRQIALKHRVGICVVHHNRKQSAGGRAGQDMLGSVALHAWVDCALYARAKEDNSRVVQLDRESKEDQGVSIRFEVPHMRRDYRSGEQQLWDPVIIPLSAQDPPQTTGNPEIRGEKSTAGKGMAWKLRSCGGSLSRQEFLDRVGASGTKLAQLDAAIANGYITQDAGGILTAVG